MELTYAFRCFRASRWMFNSLSIKKITVIFTILLLLTSEVSASCRRRLTVQMIRYNDCLPKRLLTYSCVGTCSTHAQIAGAFPFEIERTCYQCKESVIQNRRIKLKCPDVNGPSGFKDVRINIDVPKECMCEACNAQDSVSISAPQNESDDNRRKNHYWRKMLTHKRGARVVCLLTSDLQTVKTPTDKLFRF